MVPQTRHSPAHPRLSAFTLASLSFWNTLSSDISMVYPQLRQVLLKYHISQISFGCPVKNGNLILTNTVYPTTLTFIST